MSNIPLCVLMIVDSEDDVVSLVRELQHGGYDLTFEQIKTAEAMSAALDQQRWALIIFDYSMPNFSVYDALEMLKERELDLPFIILSDTIEDRNAVEAMRKGAHDYIMKDNLVQLIPAIMRELRDAEVRREYKQMMEELQKAHLHNRNLLSAITSILIGVNKNDQVIQWNKTSEKVFGIKEADVVGHPFSECGIQWDWDKVAKAIPVCIEKNQPIRLDDIVFTRPDGSDGFLGMSLNPISEKDEPSGFLLLGADITERKALELQLRQAQKMESIGRLAAGIAHEINTPIQYVGDNTLFIQESFEDITNLFEKYNQLLNVAKKESVFLELIDEIEEAVDEVDIDFLLEEIPMAIDQSLEGIDSVGNIVRSMREFSHPGVEGKILVDINKAIESTITVTRNEWKYVAEIETDFDTNLPRVSCLLGEFNQVILNIIVNAAHAIESVVGDSIGRKGKIKISTRRDRDWIEIRISDTGTGIPDKIQSKIFDPFFTSKKVGKGTGQGLAIAYNVIVEKHDGTINLETELGKGTTFIIRLPLTES